jgi:hypothetical protein
METKKRRKLSPAEKRQKEIRLYEKKARRAEQDGKFHEYAQLRLLINALEDGAEDEDEI